MVLMLRHGVVITRDDIYYDLGDSKFSNNLFKYKKAERQTRFGIDLRMSRGSR